MNFFFNLFLNPLLYSILLLFIDRICFNSNDFAFLIVRSFLNNNNNKRYTSFIIYIKP